MTDTFALERYAETRDPEAFAHLVGRYQQMVYATCLRTLGNVADAEDAAQETFVKLAHGAAGVRSNVGAWLHRTATNVSINLIRSASRRRGREAEVAQPEELADPEVWREWVEVREAVDEALGEIPEASRMLVVERYLMGRTQVELAEEQGVSASMMSRRVSGAVEQLRENLRGKGHLPAIAALVAGLGAEGAVAVPAGLGVALGKVGLVGVGAAAAASVASSAVGGGGAAAGLLAAIKLKVVAAVLGGAVVVGGGALVVRGVQHRDARPPSAGQVAGAALAGGAATATAPTAGRVLRPAAAAGGVSSWSDDHFKISGQTVKGIVATAYQVTSSQIEFTVEEPAGYFDVDLEGRDWPDVLREAFRTEMGLVGRVTYRMVPTYVLRRIEGQPHKLRAPAPGASGGVTSDRHGRRFEGVLVEMLRANLIGWLGTPVIDETGIAGRYDFDLPSLDDQGTRPTAEQYAEAIRDNLGLELVEIPGGTRQPVVVVSKDEVILPTVLEVEEAGGLDLNIAFGGEKPPPGVRGEGMTVRALIGATYGVLEPWRIMSEVPLPTGRYDIDIKKDPWRPILQNALRQQFGLTVRRQVQQMPAYALRVPEGGTQKLKPYDQDSIPSDASLVVDAFATREELAERYPADRFIARGNSEWLARQIGFRIGRRVIDQTGLIGPHQGEMDLPGAFHRSLDDLMRFIESSDTVGDDAVAQFAAAVRRDLGLELTEIEGGHAFEVLVVASVGASDVENAAVGQP